jgi:hypothetical protein
MSKCKIIPELCKDCIPNQGAIPSFCLEEVAKTSRDLTICLSGRDSNVAPTEYKRRISLLESV